jgi:superfamily II DNA/RNA helicase
VASDVAARGLDIPEVSQVFNYAPPPNSDDYVHRIGRTGRAGRSGESFTIVSPGDTRLWDAVLKRIGKDVEPFKPEGLDDAIGEARSRGPAPGRDRFDKGRRRRGRDRDRGERDRDRTERPAPEPAIVAGPAFIPATPVEEIEADEPAAPVAESRPRREEPRRRGRDRDRNREGRNRRGEKTPGDPQGGDEKFKGMGDHVPAFLLRSLGSREDA